MKTVVARAPVPSGSATVFCSGLPESTLASSEALSGAGGPATKGSSLPVCSCGVVGSAARVLATSSRCTTGPCIGSATREGSEAEERRRLGPLRRELRIIVLVTLIDCCVTVRY